MRITKKLRQLIDERNRVLGEYLIEQGARQIDKHSTGTEFEFATPAGPWFLTLYDNWIATRFTSHRGYELVTGHRSTNSKWNIHYEHDVPPEEILRILSWDVARALSCNPSPADQQTIADEVAENDRRTQYLRAYLEQQFGRYADTRA